MLKRLTVLVPILILVSGCSSEQSEVIRAVKQSPEKIVLRIFDRKVEVADKLKGLEALYEKEHPEVDLKVETLGSNANFNEELYSKIALNEAPDIFSVDGYGSFEFWKDIAYDVTDKSWMKEVITGTTDSVTREGRIYGTPIALEAYGFLYNKELFRQARITQIPTTLNELRIAAQTLQSKGITPFSNGYREFWVNGMHNFNVAVASQPDPHAFLEQARKGQIDFTRNKELMGWVDLLDLTLDYGNKQPVATDYNTQVKAFIDGKAAMMQQGNWTQLTISQSNPNLQVGMLPMPVDDANRDYIYTGVPNYWIINKESEHPQEAEKFMNWLLTSETGKQFLIKQLKFVPALKNFDYKSDDLGSIAESMQEYTEAGKTKMWYWDYFPEGATGKISDLMQAYMEKKINREQLLKGIQSLFVESNQKGGK
ncbi:ABC transporter substrate-binding protein [Paenibacillus hexagrammi]|uniref:Extracellular solute-binding protein n=1 Tax=Paenibacillus hexagrammi TaxID=2908839 RepID=A0ABY3SCY2_9BACL|nr:extracellular solute-binding protein [Paenibacillus sp. YPD9-1]UJF31848.1 extracellular solute-binding protein [Paenibacillus sp. YPD9-1]